MAEKGFRVAIVGGGISGACAASVLCSAAAAACVPPVSTSRNEATSRSPRILPPLQVDLYDQGQRGVGGRASDRRVKVDGTEYHWDHGCQFFRADTPRMQTAVNHWISQGYAAVWEGNFVRDEKGAPDFFGFPSLPPFYVGVNGIKSIVDGILQEQPKSVLSVHSGTRVARIERLDGTVDGSAAGWMLYGPVGKGAFHDTPKDQIQHNDTVEVSLPAGEDSGERVVYDAVILTDASSTSFGKWHRASATGLPEAFTNRVRDRVGARVPLFAAMVAYNRPLEVEFDAASITKNNDIWFVAKSSSKPGFESASDRCCWTIVSTPEFAMKLIEETPMRNPKTGEFQPQDPDYLARVPAPLLERAFRFVIESGHLGNNAYTSSATFPAVVCLHAQRWGSAMSTPRTLNNEASATRREIVDVWYDSAIRTHPLAPTQWLGGDDDDDASSNFLVDEELLVLQAGDMMSLYTPGLEGAALSGMNAADCLITLLLDKGNGPTQACEGQ